MQIVAAVKILVQVDVLEEVSLELSLLVICASVQMMNGIMLEMD